MSEYESTLLPIKTCDYCGTRGTMCTFANGETLCDKCMKELPITCTEARKEVYRLRAENQQQAERIKELEVESLAFANQNDQSIAEMGEQLAAAEKALAGIRDGLLCALDSKSINYYQYIKNEAARAEAALAAIAAHKEKK